MNLQVLLLPRADSLPSYMSEFLLGVNVLRRVDSRTSLRVKKWLLGLLVVLQLAH